MGVRAVDATERAVEPPPHPIDCLILVALRDELDAVLDEGGGAASWRALRDRDGLPYHARELASAGDRALGVAAAWTGAMGMTAAASRAAQLIRELAPSCIAMCGICAGVRGDVALGDVIVADRVYSFDHGKLIAPGDGAPQAFCHDITTYNLERAWQLDAAALRRDLGWAAHLVARRPPAIATQRRWLLHAVHGHEHRSGPPPIEHPERTAMFRIRNEAPATSDWSDRILELRRLGLLADQPGVLRLTERGRLAVEDDRLLYPEGLPRDPPFQVHIGAIATGNAVIEDPAIFDRLRRIGRKTVGLEMEAFAIGYVGDALPHRAIVAKAVSDHADGDKDDRFRDFACRASAAWLLAFLAQQGRAITVVRAPAAAAIAPAAPHEPREPDALDPCSADGAQRIDEFHRRVHRALALRHPDAEIAWRRGPDDAPSALRAYLEVRIRGGRYTRAYPVLAIDGAVTRAAFDGFIDRVVARYRAETPFIEPLVVHGGAVVADLVDAARRWGVRLESLLELQGLLDFRPYLAEQTRVLERDPVYPSALYVPQRIACRVGLDERIEDNALDVLDTWLGNDGPQLLLVLGDFGTGKTFLSHELALRLGRRDGAAIPILVELRKLEKARSLDALLGQHFIPERGMKRFDYDAFRYMLEEGRVALIFDGFDELALRVTYEAATAHLETVLQAAIGKAKVVITSRTQHFISDQQVLKALGERVAHRGFRMARLLPFDAPRIQLFLAHRFENDEVARRWFDLLGEVKDLLGLSHNPRLLGFIAEIPEHDLRRAAEGGEITSATLYRVLLERWLGHEVVRDHPPGMEAGLPAALRWKAATALAVLVWPREERTIAVGDIPPALLDEVERLAIRPLGRDAVAFKLGSGTLLSRDEDGRFSFIHHSIVEWLVANAAADDVRHGHDSALLAGSEMTDLMADFLWALVGQLPALAWARQVLSAPSSEILTANANRLLRRLRGVLGTGALVFDPDAFVHTAIDLSGQDLRGQDLSNTRHLRGAVLERANLSEASLVRTDLSGAQLAGARLRRANLEGADLRGADLRGADLAFARLLGADLRGARLQRASLRYAKLVGAQLDPGALRGIDVFGAAAVRPGRLTPHPGRPFGMCRAIAWSPDGVLLAVGCHDGSVVLTGGAAGSSLRALVGHAQAVNAVAVSPDGKRVASGSDDHSIALWDIDTGTRVRTLVGHAGPVDAVAFSPDGEFVASGSRDGTVRLWRAAAAAQLHCLDGHTAAVTCVAFAADGQLLASGSRDTTVRLWSLTTGLPSRALDGHTDWVNSVAFVPGRRIVASGSSDGTVRLWLTDTCALLRSFAASPRPIHAIAVSPDGRLLASGGNDENIELWQLDASEPLRPLKGHAGAIRGLRFSPTSRQLASSSNDDTVRIWSYETATPVRTLDGDAHGVGAIAVSAAGAAGGRFIATGSFGKIWLWNPASGALIRALDGHTRPIHAIAVSSDGRMLASAARDATIRLWRPATGTLLHTLDGHTGAVNSVAFSPDDQVVATGSDDNTVRLWSPESGHLVHALDGGTRQVKAVAFSPDGRILATGGNTEVLRLWNPRTGQLIRELRTGAVRCAAFSATGGWLATLAPRAAAVRLWSPETGAVIAALDGHAGEVRCIAVSRNGALIATGSADRTVRLWRGDTGALVRALDGHSDGVDGVAFSPDGALVAAGGHDGTIRLWRYAAPRGDDGCLATIVPSRGGWMTVTPDGRYKLRGDAASLPGFVVGLCHFEPGELDPYPTAFDHPPRRVSLDEPLVAPEFAEPVRAIAEIESITHRFHRD